MPKFKCEILRNFQTMWQWVFLSQIIPCGPKLWWTCGNYKKSDLTNGEKWEKMERSTSPHHRSMSEMIAKSFAPFLLSNISASRQMIKEWPFRNFRLPKSSPKEAKSSWTLILRKSHTSFCNEDKWGAWDFLRKMGRNQTFLMDHHSHSIITFDVDNKSSPEIWLNQLIS